MKSPDLKAVLRAMGASCRQKDDTLKVSWDMLTFGPQADTIIRVVRVFYPKSSLTSKGLSSCTIELC